MRPLIMSFLIFIIILVGGYELYNWHQKRHIIHRLSPDLRWVGVIDRDLDQTINVKHILEGRDLVLVVDHTNYLFQQLLKRFPNETIANLNKVFDIALFDFDDDGLITPLDPIFRHLYVIVYINNGQQYLIRSLLSVGIHGIIVKHRAPGTHQAILTDSTAVKLFDAPLLFPAKSQTSIP